LLFVLFHEEYLQLTVQVCCLFYFLPTVYFSKEKQRRGFLVGFTDFFSVFFIKPEWYFLVGSNYIKPEDNHGRVTDFLSLISIFSYLKLVDIADFMMHH